MLLLLLRSCCCCCCCRPDWDAAVSWLQGMGADLVTTEQKLKADLGETHGKECAFVLLYY
jgi:hypothetical protein